MCKSKGVNTLRKIMKIAHKIPLGVVIKYKYAQNLWVGIFCLNKGLFPLG